MASDEGVHADENSSSNPRLWHACCVKWVLERKNIESFHRWRKNATLLVLKKSVAEKERFISSSVCATTKPSWYTIDTEASVDLVGHNLATLGYLSLEHRRFVEENWCMISWRRRNSRDRKGLTIYEDWFSIPEFQSKQTSSCKLYHVWTDL